MKNSSWMIENGGLKMEFLYFAGPSARWCSVGMTMEDRGFPFTTFSNRITRGQQQIPPRL
ncbi:MAG: hypothetical protein ACYSUL_12425 [Planctomycetota bacterium]